jgi:LPXTG-motif cell wall-anchored protein
LPTATVAPPPTTLPQTGLDAWGVALLGLGLILVVFAARRLRRA